jgi:hypothetical protein
MPFTFVASWSVRAFISQIIALAIVIIAGFAVLGALTSPPFAA